MLTPEDRKKVSARLVGWKPIVDRHPALACHGPSLNLAFEGKATIDNTQPTGSVTIRCEFRRDGAGDPEPRAGRRAKLVPVIAMAKGLGKAGADGAMVWVCDIGRTR